LGDAANSGGDADEERFARGAQLRSGRRPRRPDLSRLNGGAAILMKSATVPLRLCARLVSPQYRARKTDVRFTRFAPTCSRATLVSDRTSDPFGWCFDFTAGRQEPRRAPVPSYSRGSGNLGEGCGPAPAHPAEKHSATLAASVAVPSPISRRRSFAA
jgi:hypothetical protein